MLEITQSKSKEMNRHFPHQSKQCFTFSIENKHSIYNVCIHVLDAIGQALMRLVKYEELMP